MILYKLFMSPISTKAKRKKSNELLAGNIFAKEGIDLSTDVYQSLLETLALKPKKKHYKKLIQHIIDFKAKDKVEPKLIDMLIRVGIDQRYPTLLGHTMKFLLQNDYEV